MEHIEIISQKLMIVAGINMYILGFIGNIFNICVFTIWSRSSQVRCPNNHGGNTSNSPLYLLTSSCANLIIILYPLLTRIILDGYKYLITHRVVFILCKLRFYVLYTADFVSLACICMATLDRYLISSRNARLRRLNSTRRCTKYIILIIICLFGLHNIPLFIYFDISNVGQCSICSKLYSYYYLYADQILLHGIIPICFLSIFSILIYKQLRMIKRQRNLNIDKQSSRMLLLICITIILSSLPYSIEHVYYVIVSNDSNQVSPIVFLCHIIASILFYTNSVFSFYIYYFSTPNFRRQVWKLIQCNKNHHRFMNQVNVIDVPLTVCK